MRVFSSAYGSPAPFWPAATGACCPAWCVTGPARPAGRSATELPAPFPFCLLRRSWRPMIVLLRPRQGSELPPLLRGVVGHDRLGDLANRAAEVRAAVGDRRRLATVHAERDRAVGRHLVADLHLERALDFLLREP